MELTTPNITEMCKKLYSAIVPCEYEVQHNLNTELKTYTREIFVPAGHILIGKKHAKSCINILAQGSILLKDNLEDKGKLIEVTNKTVTFISPPGIQKIAYVIQDMIFINVFTDVEAKELEEVEAELIIPDNEFIKFIKEKEIKCLG